MCRFVLEGGYQAEAFVISFVSKSRAGFVDTQPQAVKVSIISRANASGVSGFMAFIWGVILSLLFSGLSRVALWFIFDRIRKTYL